MRNDHGQAGMPNSAPSGDGGVGGSARRGDGGVGGSAWRGDRGSASLWLLAVGLALAVLAVAIATLGSAIVARHRARNAADAGALAGALFAVVGVEAACAAADRLVVANGGRLVACSLAGLDVTVTAEMPVPGGLGTTRQTARAGPVRALSRPPVALSRPPVAN